MPIGDPRDGLFYPTLTMDIYILLIWKYMTNKKPVSKS